MASRAESDLIEIAYGDPERAIPLARDSAARERGAGNLVGASRALRALGLAQRGTNDLASARESLTEAIELATGDPDAEVAARATMAGVDILAGRLDEAEAECHIALALGDVPARAHAVAQLGLVQLRRGDSAGALASFDSAVGLASRVGDRMIEANARTNRAILRAYGGRCRAAANDLARAREVYADSGQRLAAAGAAHNLGFALGRAGDYPNSLRQFDVAAAEFSELGVPSAELDLDRCEVLISAGLAGEAIELATRASADLATAGMSASHAEALVALARAQLLAGRVEAARTVAGRAVSEFEEQRRDLWGATAAMIDLECRWQLRELGTDALADGHGLSAELRSAGLIAESEQTLLRTAQIAAELGHTDDAIECVELMSAHPRELSLHERAVRSQAYALRSLLRDDRVTFARHLRAGIRAFDELQATLGSSELRAGVGRFRTDLVNVGVRQAIDDRRVAMALRWVERGRRSERADRQASDSAADGGLSELRSATAERAASARQGRPDHQLEQKRRTLEAEVVRQLRTLPGAGTIRSKRFDLTSIRSVLAGRGLHEFFVLDTELCVIRVTPATIAFEVVGRLDEVRTDIVYLRTALKRLRREGLDEASASAARASATRSARALADRLFPPDVRHESCVISPPADLLDVPWMALPNLAGTEVWVTPSASHWLYDADEPHSPTVGLLAGPRLDHAESEIDALATIHETVDLASGGLGTTSALKRLLTGCSVLHIAAHGEFREDSPLFSTIELHDGPIVLADLETELAAPATVVLAMCDSGRVGVRPGDEAIGLATAFFALGTRRVVTSVLPIDDRGTVPLMLDVHRSIAKSGNPAEGLAVGTARLADLSDVEFATRASFMCVGAP